VGRLAALVLGLAATGLLAAGLCWLVVVVARAARRAYLRFLLTPEERALLDERRKRVQEFLAQARQQDADASREERLRDRYRRGQASPMVMLVLAGIVVVLTAGYFTYLKIFAFSDCIAALGIWRCIILSW
jgi:hypothetical protein